MKTPIKKQINLVRKGKIINKQYKDKEIKLNWNKINLIGNIIMHLLKINLNLNFSNLTNNLFIIYKFFLPIFKVIIWRG